MVRLPRKYPILKWPFIRGVVALGESFGIGMKALLFSADQFLEDESDGDAKANAKLSPWEGALMITVALAFTVLLFVVLPLLGRMLLNKFVPGVFWGNIFESLLRMLILVAYISGISFLKDIKRVFAYHGAEHKVINAFEAKLDLTVENAQRFKTFHPRCGTSFLLFVVIISAICFSFLRFETIWMRLGFRILLLPFVAGISYEIIKFTGKNQNFFLWRWISLPGFWLQRLTTREPDDQQVEVALNALVAVLKEEAPVIVGGKAYVAEPVPVEAATS